MHKAVDGLDDLRPFAVIGGSCNCIKDKHGMKVLVRPDWREAIIPGTCHGHTPVFQVSQVSNDVLTGATKFSAKPCLYCGFPLAFAIVQSHKSFALGLCYRIPVL